MGFQLKKVSFHEQRTTKKYIEELNYLAVLSKVCFELEIQVGICDKIVSEFVVDIGRNSNMVEKFKTVLKSYDVEFTHESLESLFDCIHEMLPPTSENDGENCGKCYETRDNGDNDGGRCLEKQKVLKEEDDALRFLRELSQEIFNDSYVFKVKDGFLSQVAAIRSQLIAVKKRFPEKKAPRQSPSLGRKSNLSIQEHRKSLAIFKTNKDLLEAFHSNQVLVVSGETVCGKTTQLPLYLAETKYTTCGKIVITQPRRVAAISAAKRVAQGYGSRIGAEVGYSILFDDRTGPDTFLKYMIDGLLLREMLVDEDLLQYSVIIVDDAQERTIYTSILCALLKKLVERRRNLRLLVISDELNTDRISDYFCGCQKFTIPIKKILVDILYMEQSKPTDYVKAALTKVVEIHHSEPEGDILVLLTGTEEVDIVCERLRGQMAVDGKHDHDLIIIIPVHTAFPCEMESIVFDHTPPGNRKIIVAINIAEAAMTIRGVKYVVDPEFEMLCMYNQSEGCDFLVVAPISQQKTEQRARLAGRSGPGKCFQLYPDSAFVNEVWSSSFPKSWRANLGMITLTLKAIGFQDLLLFGFMDPLPARALFSAVKYLYGLGALDHNGLVTEIGHLMAQFPLEPPLSKMLIESFDLGCTDEIVTIIRMILTENHLYRPNCL